MLVNNVLYVSGSLGLIPETGMMVPGGAVAECRQSLINIGQVLKSVGANFNNGTFGPRQIQSRALGALKKLVCTSLFRLSRLSRDLIGECHRAL